MVNYLNNYFPGRWYEASNMNAQLSPGEWTVVMRIGKRVDSSGNVSFDYHFWYRTNTGQWAYKRGKTDSELLPAPVTPLSAVTPLNHQLTAYGYTNFYDSTAVYYVVR